MAGTNPTTLVIIISAMRKLGVLSSAQSEPAGEDTEFALDEFNGIVEQWNLRKRNAFFQRSQSFTFTTSKQSYTIGAAYNSLVTYYNTVVVAPDFLVASGCRP